jgi:hypothetical protein
VLFSLTLGPWGLPGFLLGNPCERVRLRLKSSHGLKALRRRYLHPYSFEPSRTTRYSGTAASWAECSGHERRLAGAPDEPHSPHHCPQV